MTDKEKVLKFFKELGIGWIVPTYTSDVEQVIQLNADSNECTKVEGYSGFTTDFEFDKEGNFIKVVIAE